MIRQYVYCDLLEAFQHNDFDAIAHGCNCFHTMGAGVAGSISKTFPVALEADKKTEYGDWSKLGDVSIAKTVNGDIINAYTQFRPGKCPEHVLYDSIRKAFTVINEKYAGKSVGIPKIGAGIAGGTWEKIAEIINEVTPDVNIYVLYI
ncbi:phosphatase [Acinetobacter phage vB_AbaM_Konradin]|uniref:O-acetyl-ADP-ribose deacetylase n=9 Tax=Lazarusvirus TaxID=2842820 RepID=A0A4Y1NL39_9CAUD|nr:phosphatase [Acinetobacter phage vB_ApiM_fHyAci03]YP_009881673.1 phosphatase [Acinetobacter phage KARL-1]YP_009885210.1 phosphatase [Acinetobacter phage vB_AbaM_Konradin]YP_009886055.1 phosphatase [Acinetobacter phage vB_AbaM_Berthold]YP_009886548.1 phosphatase [Acinetobacter phage vB_AbaM_Kimel]YP_009889659.1 phosphatase [Acinetobacter phage AM101]QGT54042.1 putative O-acetyl-ADP-ribose deacetylase [Acinetobacter phage Stupor]QKE55729.1 putative O-acetyl-ADP-ribose deacetylase [Acinetoba